MSHFFLSQVKVTLPDKPHRVVKLNISDATSASELMQLVLKKANLWDDLGPWTEPYCLLTKELHGQGEEQECLFALGCVKVL